MQNKKENSDLLFLNNAILQNIWQEILLLRKWNGY